MPDEAAFLELLVDFGHELRAAGVPLGSGDVLTYCAAAAALDPSDILDLYWAGRTALITRREQIVLYERCGLDQAPKGISDPPAVRNDLSAVTGYESGCK